jgi:non-ribosomal peptide synthetase-like protein
MLHLDVLGGTPWAPRLARLYGIPVGAGARLGTLPAPTALLRIGAGATLEADVDARGWWIRGGELVAGEIHVGTGARIGARVLLMPGAHVGDGAEVEPGALVTGRVPAGERWAGVPARRVGVAGEHWPAEPPAPSMRRRAWAAMYALGLGAQSVVLLASVIPGILLLTAAGAFPDPLQLGPIGITAAALGFTASFVIVYATLVAVISGAVARLAPPGWHPNDGAAAWALWFAETLMTNARVVLFPLYASVFTRAWLRLGRMKVGRRAEVCSSVGLHPLVALADTSFVADDVAFCLARGRNGWLHVAPTAVGRRTFLGNGAVLSPGTRIGDDGLVGALSTCPADAPDGTSWLGSPPLELPRVRGHADPRKTVSPPRRLVIARGAMELVRILLPGTVSIALALLIFGALNAAGQTAGAAGMAAVVLPAVLAAALCAVAVTAAVKWVLIGRYGAGDHPLWSGFVWRDEIINTCQEQLAGAWLMNLALATPVMSVYLRAMGARIGHDVWCETLTITEFDLAELGDGAAVNRRSCVETHLFQDRIMSTGPVTVGPHATLGPSAALLPDASIGAGCCVGGRSVVLRGESLPPATRWHGAPVAPE